MISIQVLGRDINLITSVVMSVVEQKTIVFTVEGLRLRLVEMNRTTGADESNPYDFWIHYRVEIEVPNFSGFIHWSVMPSELRDLATELEILSQSIGTEKTGEFLPLDPGLNLRWHMNLRGQIDGQYRFTDTSQGPEAPTLSGSFALDQSYLKPLAMAIRRMVAD